MSYKLDFLAEALKEWKALDFGQGAVQDQEKIGQTFAKLLDNYQ